METGVAFHINKFTRSNLLVQIGPVVLKKKMKMWNVYKDDDNDDDETTTTTDNGQISIRKISLEPSAQVS